MAVVGPSGCGKSTLLDILGGLSRPTSGAVLLGGQPTTGASLDRGVVFQQYTLFPWLTALENIGFPLAVKGVGKDDRHAIAQQQLTFIGLKGFGERYPHQLSGA